MASPTTRHRPRAVTILTTAFLAGAAASVALNQALDVHLSQRKPVVESEPIFVAMRSLPVGAPVTVWDVALKNWPKAMLPTQALRVGDSFEGMLLKTPLREGQPLLSAQLVSAVDQQQLAGAAKVAAAADAMVVVDDRTRVQVSWPAAVPTKPPAAAPSATPQNEVGAAPASAAVMETPVAVSTTDAASAAAPVVIAETASVNVVPMDEKREVSLELPLFVGMPGLPDTPVSPPLADIVPADDTPRGDSGFLPARLSTDLPPVRAQPEPSAFGSLVFPPTAPAPQHVPAATTRHLVIPERIAVMVDEVTASESMRQQPAETAPPMRPVATRGAAATRQARELPTPPEATPKQQPRQPATRPQDTVPRNSLRKPAVASGSSQTRGVSPQRAETQVSPRRPQSPPPARPTSDVRSKGMQDRQTQASPKSSVTHSEEQAAEPSRSSTMFPRVSARLEQVGDEFNRWRASFGDESSPR